MVNVNALLWSCLGMAGWANALWPIPVSYTTGNSTAWLSKDVTLTYHFPGPAGNITSLETTKIQNAWRRTQDILFTENFVPWKFYPKGSEFEPAPFEGFEITQVIVTQSKADPGKVFAYEDMVGAEAYNLTIPAATSAGYNSSTAGAVYIEADSTLGVLHAFTTLTQLFYASSESKEKIYSKSLPIAIQDKPLYVHRGLNFDVSRQWYGKDSILRTIDGLAWNKLNRLHLHATDAQSWPLEIPSMPELSKKGAYNPSLTYTPGDLQEILDYAEARGVMVIVETDMPGHTTSIAEAYPELIVGKNLQPWANYAAQPPTGSLKLKNPEVEKFVSDLFADLLPRLRGHSPYFHTGGDEVNKNIYEFDEAIGSNDSSVLQPAIQEFVLHAHSEVKKNQMSPIVWEEMLLDWNITAMDKDVIVQTWVSEEATKEVTSQGYRAITGNSNFWYLDCGNGQWLDFGPDVFATYYPFADYCSPKKNWRLVYSYDPVAGLTDEEKAKVLGGEMHIWSEQIDPQSLDVMLWPRASAGAEVLWSGRQDAQGVNRTFADASPRLGEIRERMVNRGVNASPFMQLWCFQNNGDCELN